MGDWSLDIQDLSWVEHTVEEVDFVVEALELHGGERILDLACGFGRHSLALLLPTPRADTLIEN